MREPGNVEVSAGALLELDAISCWRGERLLLDQLSLRLDCGELAQLRGPNGSGKTTLLRIVAGLTEPDSGEVRWSGRSQRDVRQSFARSICWLAHKDGLKNDLTVRENLRFDQALGAGADANRLLSAATELEIETLLDLPAAVLSAGQRRRAALARLMLGDARLWLLDEPFTNLDRNGLGVAEQMITAHVESGGMCMLASHGETQALLPSVRYVDLG